MFFARYLVITIAMAFAGALNGCQTRWTTTADPSDIEFRQLDQRLLDAIAPGDRVSWDRTLSADSVYVDENGARLDRAAFLKQLQPLPMGTSGHIEIVEYEVTRHGDVALVIHRDEETEDYFGQPLHAQYLMTETWLRSPGGWKLALVHAYVVNHDPSALATDMATLDGYTGRYSGGPLLAYEILREGEHLVGGQPGGKHKRLEVEVADVLFAPGDPRSRKIFRRDALGAVIGFVDRREGVDIIWRRAR